MCLKINEGYDKLDKYINKPLKDILEEEQIEKLNGYDKGAAGKMVESLIGLEYSHATIDFEDGELKTCPCNKNGNPLETMAINQISDPDILLNPHIFEQTVLYKKVKNMLIVFICKESSHAGDWFIHSIRHIELEKPTMAPIMNQIRDDFYHIGSEAEAHITRDENNSLHTFNGKYIQIRPKASKPYKSMHSEKYNRDVSDKSCGFYFRRSFLKDIQNKTI